MRPTTAGMFGYKYSRGRPSFAEREIKMIRFSSFVLLLLLNQLALPAIDAFTIKGLVLQKRQAANSKDQAAFQQGALAAHNSRRKFHKAGALKLDDAITKSAQEYAEKLASGLATGHDPTTEYGENLYSYWWNKNTSNNFT